MYNLDEVREQYGMEFMWEVYPEEAPISMSELDETLQTMLPSEVVQKTFYGGRYNHSEDRFNPNDEYFIFDGYGNLESLPKYLLSDYIKGFTGTYEFTNWFEDTYDESFEEDEEE